MWTHTADQQTDVNTVSSEDVIIFTQLVDSILAENDLNTISASRIRKELQQKVDTDLTPVKVWAVKHRVWHDMSLQVLQAAINELIHARFNKKFDEDQALTNGHTATGTSTGSPDNVPKPTSNQVNGNNVSHSKSPAPSRKRPADDDSQEASELDPTPETTTPKKKVKVNGHENDDAAFAARLQAEENRRGRSTRGATVVKKPQSAKKKAVVKKKKKSSTKIKDGSDQDSGSEVTERRVNRNNPFHVSQLSHSHPTIFASHHSLM